MQCPIVHFKRNKQIKKENEGTRTLRFYSTGTPASSEIRRTARSNSLNRVHVTYREESSRTYCTSVRANVNCAERRPKVACHFVRVSAEWTSFHAQGRWGRGCFRPISARVNSIQHLRCTASTLMETIKEMIFQREYQSVCSRLRTRARWGRR